MIQSSQGDDIMVIDTKLIQTLSHQQYLSIKQLHSLEILTMNYSELEKTVMDIASNNPILEINSSYYNRHNIQIDDLPLASANTLEDELITQLHTSNFKHQKCAETIIQSLDDNGYLTLSIEDIYKTTGFQKEIIKLSLEFVQSLEPYGVGARNIQECLQIQCKYSNHPLNKLIIKSLDYLPDLAKGHFLKVANLCKSDENSIRICFEFIKTLNPKPGANYSKVASPIIPDIFVAKEDNQLSVTIADITQYIEVNHQFDNSDDPELKEYLKNQTKVINQLLSEINHRNKTIQEVCTCIFEIQKDYFLNNAPLKPMTLNMIASILNRHCSTIQRCIQNKAIDYNHQTILLKSLFASRLKDNHSSDEIKRLIKDFVFNEDKQFPKSDEKISELIANKNISVSRRTVAKYRNSLRIPNASKRKISL